MAIEMVGGIYCPLSPRDPQNRLHALVEQTRTRVALVHHSTRHKCNNDDIALDIDTVVVGSIRMSDIDVTPLSSILVMPENIACIIFTSGSTGTPKAVSNEIDN